jgi:anti-anti-sigma regulatory factor
MTLASLPSDTTAEPETDHGVHTAFADRTRATVRVSGDLDSGGVAALERLLEEHYAAGRRFLRISVAGVRRLSTPLIALLERTHYRMLARRGTSIITGAGPEVMRELRELGLDEVLLVVETCADERAPHSRAPH